jgi:hypothetical protein
VDVKEFLSFGILMASIFMGGIFSVIGRGTHFFMGRFLGGLWAVQGFNVEEREEQNRKECDENSGRLLVDFMFMGGSN